MNTPRYEYSRSRLSQTLEELTSLQTPFGLTVRYAVKANPHPEIISMAKQAGVQFDASSEFEAQELIDQGIAPAEISLSSQQTSKNLRKLAESGVKYVATSLQQVEQFCALGLSDADFAVRINPGVGAGGNMRTSTGGVNASFGIWHEYIPEVQKLCDDSGVTISRVHIHVGSGADPSVWNSVMVTSLEVMERVPSATILDIGGGFKVHRYGNEQEAQMPAIFESFSERLLEFKETHGRELALEIEPGTYMVAHCGTLVAEIDDIVDTGSEGYTFIKLNTGMNDFLRSSMYGSEHKIEVMNDSSETMGYVVVGHNCESGDILTPQPGDSEGIKPRKLRKAAVGDEVRVYDTGAYCASMRTKGYNSFPDATEHMVD